MNIDRAGQLTRNVAFQQKNNWREAPCKEMTYEHIEDMWFRWSRDSKSMSDTKKCRWLGWMQATIVAATYPYTDLEVMKNINKDCAG